MDTILSFLDKYGYAIIPNILTEQECDDNIKLIWKWLENLGTDIKQNDPSTWKGMKWPSNIHGIIQHHRIGHTDFAWNVRSHKNVYKAFSKIWNTNKLLVSYDGACIMKPPEITGYWTRNTSWFHTDQSYRDSSKKCIQGLITLEDMGSMDGTLKVLAGSHKYHKDFVKYKKETNPELKAASNNWYKLKNDELEWYLKQDDIKEIRIDAPKGSLVLWDSRTIHQNSPPLKGREHPRWRYVIYACMLPSSNSTSNDLKKKIKAFNELRMTTHWPYPVYLFQDKPRTYGKDLPKLKSVTEIPDLSPLARKLVGLDPY